MNREGPLRKRILIWASQQGWRLFRNFVGNVWVGKISEDGRLSFRNRDTYFVELYDARCIKVGLCEDSSDLIGWRTLIITPEMVGKRIAQFCTLEAKTINVRLTQGQRNFLYQVTKAGGYAAVVREREGKLLFEEVSDGSQNHSNVRQMRKDA